MPYCARKHQLMNSLLYHVYSRGNARAEIFHSDGDYKYFKTLLIEYGRRFNIKVYHWVIMPNHYHLLLELADPEVISKCMAGLSRTYACYHHRIYHTAGFLWQGRFKLQPVQKEDYMITCGRYIERNPVRAKIVTIAEEYLYSSARYYCLGRPDGLTTESIYYAEFGAETAQRRLEYSQFLQAFDEEQEMSFNNMEQPRGNKEFILKLIKQ